MFIYTNSPDDAQRLLELGFALLSSNNGIWIYENRPERYEELSGLNVAYSDVLVL